MVSFEVGMEGLLQWLSTYVFLRHFYVIFQYLTKLRCIFATVSVYPLMYPSIRDASQAGANSSWFSKYARWSSSRYPRLIGQPNTQDGPLPDEHMLKATGWASQLPGRPCSGGTPGGLPCARQRAGGGGAHLAWISLR